MKRITTLVVLLACLPMDAQEKAVIDLLPQKETWRIEKEIYGHFAEHLGTCIYGGLWVGPDSHIPNTQGYRNDVLDALKNLQIPVLRWPGGCFADEYHWREGIGPRQLRPKMINTHWGGTVEDNSFGTHEFLNLCELLGCEPYISANLGSGTVEEMADWVEYMTSPADSPLANLRRENGRDKPWKVTYLGVGNESWGCGGNMRPEFYADQYRRYATYCRNFGDNRLFKIAVGPSDFDVNWTEVMMKNVGRRMDGLSVHFYTVYNWNAKGSATKFTSDDYYWTLGKCLDIDNVIKSHSAVMDRTDPDKRISLMVDEWGTWWDEEPGTVRGHLYQQNTMRDAFVAALSLMVFHQHADRVKMANIAQLANVLQAMVLTKDDKMILTPSYHVFEMFKVHQGAAFMPLNVKASDIVTRDKRVIQTVYATASVNEKGIMHISLANVCLDKSCEVTVNLNGVHFKEPAGRILTSAQITDYNDFDHPHTVMPVVYSGLKSGNGTLTLTMPAKSIVTLELLPAGK